MREEGEEEMWQQQLEPSACSRTRNNSEFSYFKAFYTTNKRIDEIDESHALIFHSFV